MSNRDGSRPHVCGLDGESWRSPRCLAISPTSCTRAPPRSSSSSILPSASFSPVRSANKPACLTAKQPVRRPTKRLLGALGPGIFCYSRARLSYRPGTIVLSFVPSFSSIPVCPFLALLPPLFTHGGDLLDGSPCHRFRIARK